MKILTAMSGGVDSSVAAYLLQREGHEVIGGMMKLFTDDDFNSGEGDARAIADSLGIPFYVFDVAEAFAAEVTERFVQAYLSGLTPNPCVDCNRFMKFGNFLSRASELECEKIATGHYARIEKSASGRFLLKKGADANKDQSYVLYTLTQEQLSHTVFPLGEMTKEEIRNIAETRGFANANKRDSQDICFVPDGDYAGFIERHTNSRSQKGNFISADGKISGEHKGIIHYTIGQRKGLGLSAANPLFVTAINAAENTIIVGASEELFSKNLFAHEINLIPFEKLNDSLRVNAKIRYAHVPQPATLRQTDIDRLHIEFDHPQRAITPGQSVVLYDGDIIIGGGKITPVHAPAF
jgi:tRNA-specific 2-thiouridylase